MNLKYIPCSKCQTLIPLRWIFNRCPKCQTEVDWNGKKIPTAGDYCGWAK